MQLNLEKQLKKKFIGIKNKNMKRLVSIILIICLSLSSLACSNVVNANSTQQSTQSSNSDELIKKDELTKKIENLFKKDVFKPVLNGNSISQLLSEELSKMSDEDKKYLENQYPQISLDNSNFENDEKTYVWLSKIVRILLKYSIDNGYLTQKQIDEYKGYLSFLGIKISDVEIKKEMSDADIEKLSIAFVDILDKISNPTILKILGIDLSDPNILSNLPSLFGIK